VYYTSGMELFISTMETNALMGKNVAKLIVDDMARCMVKSSDGHSWGDEQKVLN
jgi:prenylcysteine oxidase / farnesylcysteine lyase